MPEPEPEAADADPARRAAAALAGPDEMAGTDRCRGGATTRSAEPTGGAVYGGSRLLYPELGTV